jgi:hypothetical protein
MRPEDYVFSDMNFNVDAAHRLSEGFFRDPRDLWKPIGFPLWLALWNYSAYPLVQIVLLTGVPIFMYFAAKRWMGHGPAAAVALIGIVHVHFTGYGGLYLAETLFTFLLSLLVWRICAAPFPWSRRDSILTGLIFGLAAIVKGQIFLFAPLLLVWMAARLKWDRRVRIMAAGFFVCAALPLAAVEVFKWAKYPRVPVQAIAALSFVSGKCPNCETVVDRNGTVFGSPVYWQDPTNREVCHFDRSFNNAGFFWRKGLSCIVRNPWTLVTSFRSIYFLFLGNQPWPLANIENLAGATRGWTLFMSCLLIPGLIFAVGFSIRGKDCPLQVQLLALVGSSVLLTAYIFIAEMRHRIPFDVALVPLAVWGWSRLRGFRMSHNENS